LNDPVNLIDPNGLASLTFKAFLGVGLSATVGKDDSGFF
jgi:hypothetical protein